MRSSCIPDTAESGLRSFYKIEQLAPRRVVPAQELSMRREGWLVRTSESQLFLGVESFEESPAALKSLYDFTDKLSHAFEGIENQ